MKLAISTIGLILEILALIFILAAIVGGVFNQIVLAIVVLAIINYAVALYHLRFEKPVKTRA